MNVGFSSRDKVIEMDLPIKKYVSRKVGKLTVITKRIKNNVTEHSFGKLQLDRYSNRSPNISPLQEFVTLITNTK